MYIKRRNLSFLVVATSFFLHGRRVIVSFNNFTFHNSVNCDRPGECSPEKDCLR